MTDYKALSLCYLEKIQYLKDILWGKWSKLLFFPSLNEICKGPFTTFHHETWGAIFVGLVRPIANDVWVFQASQHSSLKTQSLGKGTIIILYLPKENIQRSSWNRVQIGHTWHTIHSTCTVMHLPPSSLKWHTIEQAMVETTKRVYYSFTGRAATLPQKSYLLLHFRETRCFL